MGTTLTGTFISQTFDALIKVTDNDNLTSTAKRLTDGLGNDSPLFLSTTKLGVGVTPTTTFQVSGNSQLGGNLTVTGNLIVQGTTTTVDTDTLSVKDPLIIVGSDNTSSDAVDLGFYGVYDTSGSLDLYAGLFRDASDAKFHLFKDLQTEPTTTVNKSATGYTKAGLVVGALEATTGSFTGNIELEAASGFAQVELGGPSGAIIDLKKPFSDDYDLRLTTATDSEITASGTLKLNAGNTLTLTLDGSNQSATFTGNINATRANGDHKIIPSSGQARFTIESPSANGNNVYLALKGPDTEWRFITNRGDLNSGNQGDLFLREETQGVNVLTFVTNTGDANFVGDITVSGGDITLGGTGRIQGIDTVSASTDAANKAYVDSQIAANNELSEVLTNGNTTGGNNIVFGDSATIGTDDTLIFGAGNDLRIAHNGTDSVIRNFTGGLFIDQEVDNGDISFRSDDGSGGKATYYFLDGSTVMNRFVQHVQLDDNIELRLGTNQDLRLEHTGSDGTITNFTGNLTIQNNTDDGDIIFKSDNGSGGTENYIQIDGSEGRTTINKPLRINDSVELQIGSSADLKIYHDSNNSKIQEGGTGSLVLDTNGPSILLTKSDTEFLAKFITDGAVELYHDNSKKFETTSTGVSVTGNVTIENTSSTTNDSVNVLDLKSLSSGTTANGFGVGVGFFTENSTYSTVNELGRIEVVETAEANLNDKMIFYVKHNNVLAERLNITGTGATFAGNVALNGLTNSDYDADADNLVLGASSGNTGITILSGSSASNFGSIYFADGTSSTAAKAGFIRYEQNTSEMTFGINAVQKLGIALDGTATFAGTITSGAHLINASSSAFGGSSVQGVNTDFLVDSGQGYARINSYHTGGGNIQFLTNAASSTTNSVALELSKDNNATFAGNVGIGVTPESWGTSGDTKALRISTMTSLSEAFDGTILASNFYFNGSNDKYIESDFATQYIQIDGTHLFKVAASGTANNNISFTTALTIANDTSATFAGAITASVDNDTSFEFGKAHIGNIGHSDHAGFSHIDQNGTGSYALLQNHIGGTFLNAASGQEIKFRINNSDVATYNSTSATFSGQLTVDYSTADAVIRLAKGSSTIGNIDFVNEGNRFSIQDDGARRLVIDTSGNVGIGETSPDSALDVVGGNADSVVDTLTLKNDNTGNSAGAGINFVVDGGNDVVTSAIYGQRTAAAYHQGSLQFLTRDASGGGLLERMRITSGGNMLLGSAADFSRLTVSNGGSTRSTITISDQNTASLMLTAGANQASTISLDGTHALKFNFGANVGTDGGSTRMIILNNGNVGIGTTSPQTFLQIGDYPSNNIDLNSYPDVPSEHLLHLTAPETTGRFGGGISFGENAFTAANIVAVDAGAAGALHLAFGTGNSSGMTEKMRITNDGNVEIKTANAEVNFDSGNGYVQTTTGSTSLVLGVNSSEKLRIHSSGNVGIGTTSPKTSLDIVKDSDIWHLMVGGATKKLLVGGQAASGDVVLQAGAASTVNNAAVTTAYNLTLQRDGGNVGIGTASPEGRLMVETTGADATPPIKINRGRDGGRIQIQYAGNENGYGEIGQMYAGTGRTVIWIGANLNSFATGHSSAPVQDDANYASWFSTWDSYNDRFTVNRISSGSTSQIFTINSSGSVGIGLTNPAVKLEIQDSTHTTMKIRSGNNDNILFAQAIQSSDARIGTDTNTDLSFYTNASERMRIDSAGNVGIGSSSPSTLLHVGANHTVGSNFASAFSSSNFFVNNGANGGAAVFQQGTASANLAMFGKDSSNTAISFFNSDLATNTSAVGSITTTSSATAFNTSSDYRLKEDLKDFAGLDLINQIPVYDFKWKLDESRAYGVLAHELQNILPQAVYGEKDAKEMQGVDYSKIVPLLVKSIQELQKEIEILKNK